jgi:hypothetical protein
MLSTDRASRRRRFTDVGTLADDGQDADGRQTAYDRFKTISSSRFATSSPRSVAVSIVS